jgi:hypothetical protein
MAVAVGAVRPSGQGLVACVAAMMLGACVGEGPVRESTIEATLPAQVAPIVAGQTKRSAVRQALGKPWLASDYWGFDAFRISDSNVNMVVVLIPVWLSADGMKGYVLVSYDANGHVTGYGKDVASEGNLLAGTPDQGATVQAGDVRLAVSGDGDEVVVAVASARRDEYLRNASAKDFCRLLVGCAGDWCGARVAIDGRTAVAMPSATTRWLPASAPIDVKPGDHRISIRPVHWDMSFEAESRFSCAAGESLFGVIDFAGSEESMPGGLRRRLAATVTISRETAPALRDQGMLIYANGHWLVPAEPTFQ